MVSVKFSHFIMNGSNIDIEKVYDWVHKEVMWWVLEMKGVPRNYIKLIKDIYDGVVTSVRTSGGIIS